MNYEKVTLSNIGDGVAQELFQREIGAVIRNIKDVNTDPESKRKVVLEIAIAPTETRDVGQVTIKCTSKLAGVRPAKSTLHFDHKDGYVNNISQDEFDTNVLSMTKPEGGKLDA